MSYTMTTSILYADNTAPANGVVRGVGITDVDESESLININKAVHIAEDMKHPYCILAVCEKQLIAPLNHDVDEHGIKVIGLDSEDDPYPCYTMQS